MNSFFEILCFMSTPELLKEMVKDLNSVFFWLKLIKESELACFFATLKHFSI